MPCAGRGVSRCTSSLPSLSGPCHRLCTTTVQGARARSPTSPRGGGTNPGTLLITQRSPLPYSFARRSFASLRCRQVLFGAHSPRTSSSSSSSSRSRRSEGELAHLPLAPRRAFPTRPPSSSAASETRATRNGACDGVVIHRLSAPTAGIAAKRDGVHAPHRRGQFREEVFGGRRARRGAGRRLLHLGANARQTRKEVRANQPAEVRAVRLRTRER